MRAAILAVVLGCGGGSGGNIGSAADDCRLEGVEDGESCAGIAEGTQCFIEGHAACNVDPVSGGCACTGGSWQCFTSCPAGCPTEPPSSGDACTLPAGTSCPYEQPAFSGNRVECRCNGSAFDCP